MPRGTKDEAGPAAQAVAELIRREMGAQRVSGRQLAERINKGETYLRERLSGKRSFDLNDLDDIADALNLDVIVILEQAENSVRQAAAPRAVVNMSDYRRTDSEAENVSGPEQTATVTPIPTDRDLTAEEAAEILRTYPHAADSRPGRDEEQEADRHP
ncbi:helix-turn-helix domain-containing protein [Leucobacter tenebrionis]|uniref:helix-turn-helix domain-containing protein n=1 Tax=Leucobacter tenebrionis TaxID=2873270 RepID=UPI001CA7549A|nr:helix-turn-helix transcriptional regulator [Leucobacter tenebrionis]QZY52888.1 helix-turn-helix domain-containing protein [Leucobacter tenebrionis]